MLNEVIKIARLNAVPSCVFNIKYGSKTFQGLKIKFQTVAKIIIERSPGIILIIENPALKSFKNDFSVSFSVIWRTVGIFIINKGTIAIKKVNISRRREARCKMNPF